MITYDTLPDTTRVWIYQGARPMTEAEATEAQQHLHQFATQWVSHSRDLRAIGKLFHQQFIVLMVDESQSGASGCSIDASVKFVQQLAAHFNIDFFDRMTFAYQVEDTIKTAHRDEFAALYQAGKINDATLVFDNLVTTKGDFDRAWVKPLSQSWHKRMV